MDCTQATRRWSALIKSGGVLHWERVAVAEAKARALQDTRVEWLEVFERWEREWHDRFAHRKPRDRDYDEIVYVGLEIKRLRRLLRIKPTPETIREQTRRRVAAWRERQKAAWASGHPAAGRC